MTVRQVGWQTFNVPRAEVAQQTQVVLNLNPAYHKVRQLNNGTLFQLTVKPNPLLLGTKMEIELDENDSGTTVTATVTSQAIIVGDVGGFYYRYVRDFLAALQNRLTSTQGRPIVSSEASYKMETSWAAVAYLLLLIVLGIWMAFTLRIPIFRLFIAVIILAAVTSLFRLVRGGRLGT
ncbi:MAG TPA: hypothetical protein VEY08_09000 [Chloroflexia bacterium]|nr:hypothetical protein [Chloroflexia bacterium]